MSGFATFRNCVPTMPAKKKNPPVKPSTGHLHLPEFDVVSDPGLAAILAAKALAMMGELPGCQCYNNLRCDAARGAEECEHVLAFAVKSLQEDADAKIRKEYRDSQPPDEPTDAEPGSPEKEEILRRRIKHGLSCDHAQDRKHILSRPNLSEERSEYHE